MNSSRITYHASRSPRRLNVVQMVDVIGRGGAEKALVGLALHLDRSRYNVTVCATRSAGNYQPLLDAAGVRTVIIGRRSRWEMHKLLGLVRLLRRQPVHVLHTHLFGSNTWGRLLGRLAGVPVIVAHEHWSSKSRREMWIDHLLYRLSDRILVPSRMSKRLVASSDDIPPDRISVVYNGVDITQFDKSDREAARAELGIEPDNLAIGSVGRLSIDKGGQDILLRSLAHLREAHPEAKLLFVGKGPLRSDLQQLAQELAQGGAVIFTGQRADVPRLLSAMDIFVLPSLREALPIAVLEAMAARVPVIATRVGGVPEIVQDGLNGLLVPPGDEATLHVVLERLVADPQLRLTLGQAGRDHVEASFTLDKMVTKVEGIYEELARAKIGGAGLITTS
jgi:glycosyltransferase involved in cell wall biosynthesis